jgi:glycine cleavage system H protein
MSVPATLRYTPAHEWVSVDGEVATVGISHHAQEELSDVVFVELPEIGREVESGDPVAVVESVKAASDIYAPLSGEIVEANTETEGEPSLLNSDPYGKGWIYKIKFTDASELESLLDAAGYQELIG